MRRRTSITPGQVWLDTAGKRIHAHGGSLIHVDGTFYWYGENKEHSTPGSGIWHWGVSCYSSSDLYNWTDEGLIIAPEPDDPTSPLHPSQGMDRPHIIRNPATGTFICWIKVMAGNEQRSSVFVADQILGPYRRIRENLKPLGMHAGDFDLVVDPADGKGYYYFERVHSELICADLNTDYTDVTGYYSTHFPRSQPPFVREAPAHFRAQRDALPDHVRHLRLLPQPVRSRGRPSYHGPWTVQGDPHPDDSSRTSYQSQVSSVFRHPGKQDLYIALADRWLPRYTADSTAALELHERAFRPGSGNDHTDIDDLTVVDTSIADYVWLPIRFEGDRVLIDWHDEWRLEDFT